MFVLFCVSFFLFCAFFLHFCCFLSIMYYYCLLLVLIFCMPSKEARGKSLLAATPVFAVLLYRQYKTPCSSDVPTHQIAFLSGGGGLFHLFLHMFLWYGVFFFYSLLFFCSFFFCSLFLCSLFLFAPFLCLLLFFFFNRRRKRSDPAVVGPEIYFFKYIYSARVGGGLKTKKAFILLD